MAAASSPTNSLQLLQNNINKTISHHNHIFAATTLQINEGQSSSAVLRRRSSLQISATTRTRNSSKTDLFVRNATPEVAGDVITSISQPGIPGFSSLLGDNPWLAGAAGLFVTLPLLVQRVLSLTKEVDMAAQAVEKVADCVGKVAEGVDKAAEDLKESLPEGELKKMVSLVEGLAEEVVEDAQKVEDLMDKVEELDDKLEDFLHKQFKDTGKA